ncbi:hypothetical protein QN277_008802 [Acacia crassicarpa]|uniref:Uncharacterized protein n=1 Tax=Acacia crassicarpa TaxID=499986 RepID=A0AAE1M8J8_9FABA|nr:hypothetical protein QN277_008802 [Acacia crassicarpa]
MTQKDQTKKRSNSSGGGGGLRGRGRFSGKKQDPGPKVSKRGPGIAFLERERIQNEQRRQVAATISPTPPPPPPPSSPPPSPRISYLPLQLPGFHHSNQLSSSSPVPLQSSSNGVSMNFPHESNPPSGWAPRTQQYQQRSSSMVNVPSENLAVPVDYYSKEPPSNQNNSSSFVVPMDKHMVVLERSRSHPLSKDKGVPPAASSFNFKSNETESTNYLNFGEAPSAFRKVPSCPTTLSEPNSKKNKNLHGDFMSLAPPISPSESESTSTFPAAFHNQELPPRSQGTEEDQIPYRQQPRLRNSFPTKEEEEAQSVQTTETNKYGNCNSENGESLDLDLHL